MARKTLFPGLLATALIASAAASAYADPASENPAQAWIARIETPNFLPAQPHTASVKSDGAQDFLARFEPPSFSQEQPGSKAVVDNHPDRDFIARLSTGQSPIAEETATPVQRQTQPYSVAASTGR